MIRFEQFGPCARSFTPTGWAILAVTLLGALAGARANWVEAWAVSLTGATLLLTGLPFLWGARASQATLRLTHDHTVAGSEVTLTILVTNPGPLRQSEARAVLAIGGEPHEVVVPALAATATATIPVEIVAARRGVIVVGPLTVIRSDPLGLFQRERSWPDTHRLRVHPRTVGLPPVRTGMVRDLAGGARGRLTDADLSVHAVREYAAGDAIRHIHWKATAKQGSLMVRQYEETQSSHLALVCDTNPHHYEDAASFELGVSVAASFAAQAVRDGRDRFIASDRVHPGRHPHRSRLEALPSRTPTELLNNWAELRPAETGRPLTELVRAVTHKCQATSFVVGVTGELPPMTELRRAAATLHNGAQLFVVRVCVGAEPHIQHSHDLTVITMGALAELPRLLARGAV